MEKIIILYTSIYGSTRRYANWIAEALKAPALDLEANGEIPAGYEVYIIGGGLYGGGIGTMQAVLKAREVVEGAAVVTFVVGSAQAPPEDYARRWMARCAMDGLPGYKGAFFLTGNMEYKNLIPAHKAMMAGRENFEEKAGAETADHTDKRSIRPLVDYVQSLIL